MAEAGSVDRTSNQFCSGETGADLLNATRRWGLDVASDGPYSSQYQTKASVVCGRPWEQHRIAYRNSPHVAEVLAIGPA